MGAWEKGGKKIPPAKRPEQALCGRLGKAQKKNDRY
jgi:hypothetical protein